MSVSHHTNTSQTSRTLAAFCAGFLEISIFHPVDTVAKRLMSNEGTALQGLSIGEAMGRINGVVFKSHSHDSMVSKIKYLYPGFNFAVTYKVLQRGYKFGGQPVLRDTLDYYAGGVTSSRSTKVMRESISGALIGVGEIILLPVDRLKILAQTNEAALQRRNLMSFFSSAASWREMYAGSLVTATRNCIGSFFLFGGTALTKEALCIEDYRKATVNQNLIASSVGSIMSIIIVNPFDIVKTRIQNKSLGTTVSGRQIAMRLLKEEGFSALLKGATPKVLASAPKLAFAYTVTESLSRYFTR